MDAERPMVRSRSSLLVPHGWPEVVAFDAGRRLFGAGEDTVPTLIRLGSDITGYLTEPELAAMLDLGSRAFERWLRHGWAVEAEAEENV